MNGFMPGIKTADVTVKWLLELWGPKYLQKGVLIEKPGKQREEKNKIKLPKLKKLKSQNFSFLPSAELQ